MNKVLPLRYLLVGGLVLLVGCAAYKELKPDIDVASDEDGYIELLRNKKESFEVQAGTKYYIAFPAPKLDAMYLVLTMPDKKKVGTSFTTTLVKGKKPGKRVLDETPYPDTVSVYPVPQGTFDGKDRPTQFCYLLVEKVPADMVLKIKYRYALKWRYKYEVKHNALRERFARNLVDHSVYQGIGSSTRFDGFGFAPAMDSVSKHCAELRKVREELTAAQGIFPQNVAGTQDATWQSHETFSKQLDDEIAFQSDYHATLDFFAKDQQTRGKPVDYLGYTEDFIAYFGGKARYPANVLQEAQSVLKRRMEEAGPAYEQLLGQKQDGAPLDVAKFQLKAVARTGALYEAAGVPLPTAWGALSAFVGEYQPKSEKVVALRDSLNQIAAFVKSQPGMPADNLFGPVAGRVAALEGSVPKPVESQGKYVQFALTVALNRDIAALAADVGKTITGYREAEALVPQLNVLNSSRDYSAMLGLLKQKMTLTFLTDKYKDLDRMSVEEQSKNARSALDKQAWSTAEAALFKLNSDQNCLDPTVFAPLKNKAVDGLEDALYNKVEAVTRARVMKFLDERVHQLQNVDSLYTDSSFLPVYDIKFASGGKKELYRLKEQLVADLGKLKENEFPAKAVKLLYDEFVKNPGDSSVWKARAIVTHGKHYTGEDKPVKIAISECDPTLAKWITEPTKYRRVFALPVTDNEKGKNKFVVRLNVRIETEAQFPVYDVNIKLPKEVAQNASATQWYDEIKLNKNLLKNEGRFSITAPTAASEWECQITPVQMNKEGNNILDVSFTYPAFRALNLSVMVQKPIIKKN